MFVVSVKFEGSPFQTYVYLCPFTNVKVGDKVIVDSPRNGYVTVDVVAIHNVRDPHAKKATKYVVNTIDDREYLERKKASQYLEDMQAAAREAEMAVKRSNDLRAQSEAADRLAKEKAERLHKMQNEVAAAGIGGVKVVVVDGLTSLTEALRRNRLTGY